jgi:protein-tyrosine phosphatase
MLELITPAPNATVNLQTETQRGFIRDEERRAGMGGSFSFHWSELQKQGEDLSSPLPVTFSWMDTEEALVAEKGYFYLLISEDRELRDPWLYSTADTVYDVYNLKAGAVYYWCVQRNGKRSEVSSFQTAWDLPRCVKLDGNSNVRDLGGYPVEGGRIRQGLVYRGGEFELHMHLSPAGVEDLRRLMIRTELDLRGEARDQVDYTTAELLGIRRVYVPSVAYDELFKPEQKTALHSFFKVFTHPAAYPVYFHCWGGADRTGTLAFILGAFLGMSLSDLICEYEFTTLSIWGTRSRNYLGFQRFLLKLNALPGDTLREKVV